VAQDTKASGPMDRLRSEVGGLVDALGERAMASVKQKVTGATGRLGDYAEGGGGPGLMAAVTGAKGMAEGKSPGRSMLGAGFTAVKEKVRNMFGKGKGGGKGKVKVTNIVESIDVGVPISLAYNQWTQFGDFPGFMKKVESVEQAEEQKLNWKAQVFWSHRTWEATIQQQRPDDQIVWRSKGPKGHVDGSVTFHELAPNLTRILVVLEYHPQGLFERTGNLWRAQGRRVRLELKHFRRHVMSQSILHPEEIEGWRGVIEDGEVVEDHQPLSETEDQDRQDRSEDEREPEEREESEEYADEQDEYAEAEEPADESADEDESIPEEDSDQSTNGRSARTSRPAARRREPAARSRRSSTANGRERQPARRTTRRAPARGGGSS